MVSPTDETLRAYERRMDAYLAASDAGVSTDVAALLDSFVARLPRDSRVLEVGSGPGCEASYLEERGVAVDRTDATRAFVQRLREMGHPARVLDMREGSFGGPYDGVLANAVLLHLDRAEAASAVRACLEATRPGGLLALTLKEGEGEGWSDAKLGEPRWFVYWREEALRDVLTGAGWQILTVRRVHGRTEPWLHVLCER